MIGAARAHRFRFLVVDAGAQRAVASPIVTAYAVPSAWSVMYSLPSGPTVMYCQPAVEFWSVMKVPMTWLVAVSITVIVLPSECVT